MLRKIALLLTGLSIVSGLVMFNLPYGKMKSLDLIRFEIHDSVVRLLDHIFPAYEKDSLAKKVAKGPKEWMDYQISQDLQSQTFITEQDIDGYLASIPEKDRLFKYQMIKVVVDENGVRTVPERLPYFDGRRRSVIEALRRLHKQGFLEPCVFILSVADLIPDEYQSQIPIFSYSKNLANPSHKNLVLIPDGMNLSRWSYIHKNILFANKAYGWDQKKDKIFWRGSNTNKVREKLVEVAVDKPYIDAVIPTSKKEGYAIPEVQIPYKYLISLDGVSSTWPGLLWKLASNSLTIKQDSSHIQWYYQALKPNVHYLPVKNDLSDLADVYQYAMDNDTEMQKISDQAQDFIENNVLYEDMLVYIKFLMDAYRSKVYKLK